MTVVQLQSLDQKSVEEREAVDRIVAVLESASKGVLRDTVVELVFCDSSASSEAIVARVEAVGDWIRFELPLGLKLGGPGLGANGCESEGGGVSPWEAICLSSRLPASTKLAARLGRSAITLCAEVPNAEMPSGERGASRRAQFLYDSVIGALTQLSGESPSVEEVGDGVAGGTADGTADGTGPVENSQALEELCRQSGWDAKSRDDGVKVDLKGESRFLQVILRGSAEGVRATLPILQKKTPSPDSRLGLGLLLLTLHAITPGVRARVTPVDAIDGVNVALECHLGEDPTQEQIHTLLLALAGAGELCAAEMRALLDRVVADAYLASNGWSAATAKTSTEIGGLEL